MAQQLRPTIQPVKKNEIHKRWLQSVAGAFERRHYMRVSPTLPQLEILQEGYWYRLMLPGNGYLFESMELAKRVLRAVDWLRKRQ